MEYDKTLYQKPVAQKKNHLAARLNKFQENINSTVAPTQPAIQRVNE